MSPLRVAAASRKNNFVVSFAKRTIEFRYGTIVFFYGNTAIEILVTYASSSADVATQLPIRAFPEI